MCVDFYRCKSYDKVYINVLSEFIVKELEIVLHLHNKAKQALLTYDVP